MTLILYCDDFCIALPQQVISFNPIHAAQRELQTKQQQQLGIDSEDL